MADVERTDGSHFAAANELSKAANIIRRAIESQPDAGRGRCSHDPVCPGRDFATAKGGDLTGSTYRGIGCGERRRAFD
ncbi:hypothetical protein [Actinomadura rubrisoli]|uniref:Uncharacterized protein n=1 Tax=Actinomadura rubrisoli TaxID=2530368 RepID=A0A4R5C4Z7_9ACTN|nr:hypothetical protein [Actinomadura rubrisoli]TDD94791.1 hypothetical protein E1298_06390 [Actinomadura rubrisoli]